MINESPYSEPTLYAWHQFSELFICLKLEKNVKNATITDHSTVFRNFKVLKTTSSTSLQVKKRYFCSSTISHVINILKT